MQRRYSARSKPEEEGVWHGDEDDRRPAALECLSAARPVDDPAEFRTRIEAMKSEMRDLFLRTDPRAPQLPLGLSVDEQLAWFCEPPEGLD